MNRILLISYLFPPAASVGGQRAVRIANHLPDLGYRVDVLTTDMASGEGNVDEGLLALIRPGVTVHRVPARFYFGRTPWRPPSGRHSIGDLAWKAATYAEWLANPVDAYAFWADDARREAIRLMQREPYDAIMVSGPPFSPAVGAVEVKRVTGAPLIVDFRDLWGVELASRKQAKTWRLIRRVRRTLESEKRILESADLIVFTNEDAAECYRSAYPGLNGDKVVVVPNAHSGGKAAIAGVPSSAGKEQLTLLHTGSLAYGRAACALNLLRAIERLQRRRAKPRLHALFVGAGETGTVARLATPEGLDAFTEVPQVSRSRALDLQLEADVLIALQASDLGSRLAVPAKLLEYMTAGKPILGVFPEGPAARIVLEHDLGEVGNCDDVAAIESALDRLLARVEAGKIPPPPPERFSPAATMTSLAGFIDAALSRRKSGR